VNRSSEAKIPPVILLSSCAALAYEVALTRIFSISLSYHYAFMIIGIAMLGYAASGTALALFPHLMEIGRVGRYALLLGVTIPASYLLANSLPLDPVRLSWDRLQLIYLGLSYLLLAFPFFFAGLVVATAFTAASSRSALFYGADLVGAGLGSLGIILFMSVLPPERTVFLLATLPLAAAWLVSARPFRTAAIALILLDLLLFVRQPVFAPIRISPYKGLASALLFPGARHLATHTFPFARVDTFTSPAARFAPGLSLRYQEPLPPQVGIAVDADDSSAVTAAADRQALAFLDYLPSALPYVVKKPDRALLLDPRGGLQLLVARRYGAARIVTVESRPEVARVIRHDLRKFSGDLYGGESWTGLGRSWLAGRQDSFDLIDVSLLGTEPAGSFGIAEDYRFTVEAFGEYLGHLRPDGMLSVNLYIIPPPRAELRLLATITAALGEAGIADPGRHLAVIRSWGTISVLVKKTPLTGPEVAKVREFARERWFDALYYPGVAPEETARFVKMAGEDYAAVIACLLDPGRRERFLADYLFDVAPVRDDRPFFHYYLRLSHLAEIYRAMGGKWQFFLEEGLILPALLLQVLALGALLLLAPVLAAPGSKSLHGPGRPLLSYFAFLGIGYLFVETALIQKFILPLENPSAAMAAILGALLVGSGCGSLMAHSFSRMASGASLLAAAFLASVSGILLPVVLPAIATLALPVKVVIVTLLVVPLGVSMGIPFPVGIRALGEIDPSAIPWAWVTNGYLSVLAPPLAVMLAMATGFSSILLAGALAYLLAYVCLTRMVRRLKRSGIGDRS